MSHIDDALRRYDGVFKTEGGLLSGIMLCRKHGCCGSALVLVYSAIDNLAFLTMDERQNDVTSGDFKRITHQYKIGASVGVTPDELWAARCSVLHCFTAESTITRKNPKVQKLVYWYGNVQPIGADIDGWIGASLDKLIVKLVKAIEAVRRKIEQGKLDSPLVLGRLAQMFNAECSRQIAEIKED
ncbi:MAG: hypothetical protein ACYC2Y_10620 [Armatimonadota bacterium]